MISMEKNIMFTESKILMMSLVIRNRRNRLPLILGSEYLMTLFYSL